MSRIEIQSCFHSRKIVFHRFDVGLDSVYFLYGCFKLSTISAQSISISTCELKKRLFRIKLTIKIVHGNRNIQIIINYLHEKQIKWKMI